MNLVILSLYAGARSVCAEFEFPKFGGESSKLGEYPVHGCEYCGW